jgi:hypothetical protein
MLLINKSECIKQTTTMPRKLSKQDKIDGLLYFLNKDRTDNKRVSFTNLSKSKITDIDKLIVKYNIPNIEEVFNEFCLLRTDRKINEDMERVKRANEYKKICDERDNMFEEDRLSGQIRYNNYPKMVRTYCEKKMDYDEYTTKIKSFRMNFDKANEMVKMRNNKFNSVEIRGDIIIAIISGVHYVCDYVDKSYSEIIYENDCVIDIVKDWRNATEFIFKRKKSSKKMIMVNWK